MSLRMRIRGAATTNSTDWDALFPNIDSTDFPSSSDSDELQLHLDCRNKSRLIVCKKYSVIGEGKNRHIAFVRKRSSVAAAVWIFRNRRHGPAPKKRKTSNSRTDHVDASIVSVDILGAAAKAADVFEFSTDPETFHQHVLDCAHSLDADVVGWVSLRVKDDNVDPVPDGESAPAFQLKVTVNFHNALITLTTLPWVMPGFEEQPTDSGGAEPTTPPKTETASASTPRSTRMRANTSPPKEDRDKHTASPTNGSSPARKAPSTPAAASADENKSPYVFAPTTWPAGDDGVVSVFSNEGFDVPQEAALYFGEVQLAPVDDGTASRRVHRRRFVIPYLGKVVMATVQLQKTDPHTARDHIRSEENARSKAVAVPVFMKSDAHMRLLGHFRYIDGTQRGLVEAVVQWLREMRVNVDDSAVPRPSAVKAEDATDASRAAEETAMDLDPLTPSKTTTTTAYLAPPTPPSRDRSASPTQEDLASPQKGTNCHYCKNKTVTELLVCPNNGQHKYCPGCMHRRFGVQKEHVLPLWQKNSQGCPICTNSCICAACVRKRDIAP